MPRKDPVTGCMVMTMPEFLNAEAEREGKGRTGADILCDIYEEIDADSRREEARLSDPKEALELVKSALKDAEEYWEDEYGEGTKVPEIVEVVHVIEAHVSQNFSSSGQMFRAEVKDSEGRLCYFEHTYSHWSGTRLDPPEEDSTMYFGVFEKTSKHPWKCFQCGKVRETGERNWTHIKQSDDSTKAVHSCPRCNGYERKQYEKRLARRRAATLRKARK